MAADRDQPHLILVGLNRDNPQLHDAYMLDVRDGSSSTSWRRTPASCAWLVDRHLQMRGGIALPARRRRRDPGGRPGGRRVPHAPRGRPRGRAHDRRGRLHPRRRRRLSASPRRAQRRPAAAHRCRRPATSRCWPRTRSTTCPTSRSTRPRTRCRWSPFTRERADHVVLDEALRADVDAMRALHPGDLHFSGRDHADRIWILGFTADDGPVSYFAFDRSTGEASFLFEHKPDLEATRSRRWSRSRSRRATGSTCTAT